MPGDPKSMPAKQLRSLEISQNINERIRMQRIIAFTGAHGTGKTTAVYDRAAQLKRQCPETTVGVLLEVAGRSPYPINLDATPEGQLWLFAQQIQEELVMLEQYGLVVADRTALDCVAYSYVVGFKKLAMAMLEVFRFHADRYREIVFRRIRTNDYLADDGIRNVEDLAFREEVEGVLYKFYEDLGITKEDRFIIV